MLWIWWGKLGVVYLELLNSNITVTKELYRDQLDRVNDGISRLWLSHLRRKGAILQHDKARPHISIKVQQKILQLGWEVLSHPPYSSDILPSDYHLFRSLQHHLTRQEFKDEETVRESISSFIASKPMKFISDGIENLAQRRKMVIDNEGNYIIS